MASINRRNYLKKSGSLLTGIGLLPISLLARTSDGVKIIFVGDSITQAGGYINTIRKSLTRLGKAAHYELINCGLNSETISGLTERDHPGPRPYLFDRLHDVLDQHQPDIAYFCYGINCGIYNPFNKKNAKKYKKGLKKILKETCKRRIETILLTPPPIALTEEMKQELISKPPASYSWKAPYPKYEEEVLQKYVSIVESFKSSNVKVIDIHQPLVNEQSRSYDEDPIHPNRHGHEVIAKAILGKAAF